MKYVDMDFESVRKIVNKGGADLNKLNQEVVDYLDKLDLSDNARAIIAGTEIGVMAEAFGGLHTAQEVEDYIKENY